MKIEKKDTYTLISSDESSLKVFQNSLFEKINDFETAHLILQISDGVQMNNKEFSLFLNIAKQKQQNKTSFVIINSYIQSDDFPDYLNVVPTLQEAEDILEMETIERELGF
jgi:hypothetical protein